jgi:hypothetical protein
MMGSGTRISTLTTVFLGLTAIAVGLYVQSQQGRRVTLVSEGFQEAEGEAAAPPDTAPSTDSAPASAAIEIITPPSIAGAKLDPTLPEVDGLKQKVAEIRTMLAAIQDNKPKQDLTLNGILEAEVLSTMDTLVEEVTFFDSKPPSPELEMFLTHLNKYDSLTDAQKTKLRSMIFIGHQIATVLYYIYVTLPMMIVSSGVVVDPKNQELDLLVDPNVVKEMRTTINSVLAGVPRLSTKLEEAAKRLMTLMGDFKDINRINPEFIDTLLAAYNDYYRLCNIKVQTFKRQIATQKIAVQSTFTEKTMESNKFLQRTGQNITMNIQSSLDFIQTFLDTVAPIKIKVDAAVKEYPESPDLGILKNTLETTIQTMSLAKTSMTFTEKTMSPKKEGFASMGNPYNAETPNLFQALKFRIGKQTLITDVQSASLV